MLASALVVFLASSTLFILFATAVAIEERRGRRLLLSGVRSFLDVRVERTATSVRGALSYLGRHVIQLTWYYSLHSFLRTVLRIVVSLYDYIEALFHKNRDRARALRAERRARRKQGEAPAGSGMLQSVAEHKQAVALTPAQKKRLRTKKLERE